MSSSNRLTIAVLAIATCMIGQAHGQVVLVQDSFNVAHDYSDGQAFGIWDGGVNMGFSGGSVDFAASGGALTIDTNGTNIGWNGSANRSDAPFLFTTIAGGAANNPGGNFDYRATVQITSQSAIAFGTAGLMARMPSATPPTGEGGLNSDENFIVSHNVRFADGTNLSRHRMIQNGSQTGSTNDGLVGIAGTPAGPFPIWVRLERRHNSGTGLKDYFLLMSLDGTTFFEQGGSLTPGAGNALNNPAMPVDIGLSFHSFGTTPGSVTFDDFILELGVANEPCVTCTWGFNGSGDWNNIANWMGDASPTPSVPPNTNTTRAVFGSVLTPDPATVYTNSTVTVKELRFENATPYVLAGAGSIQLESDDGTALVNVNQGSHEIQVELSLASDVSATAMGGASLAINAPVYLNSHTLTNNSPGQIVLNNGTIASGSGAGAVVNDGGLVGLASLDGDLTQTEAGRLGVVVGSSPISVSGEAVLDGVLDVSLANGFTPINGQSYTILTPASVTDLGLTLGGAAAGQFRLSVAGNSVALTAVPEPAALSLLAIGAVALGLIRRRWTA